MSSSENHLTHLTKFEMLIRNYRLSESAIKTLKAIKLVLLVAPTSSGRNTILKELLKTGQYHYIVSDTTRHPRINDGVPEKNGVEYWFRSEEDMLSDLEAGRYAEAAIIHNQQVSGMSIREFEQALANMQTAITDIEIAGVQHIMNLKPDSTAIFVLPPDFKVWMQRLDLRGHMTEPEKRRRLQSAIKELTAALKHDYYCFVVNDTVGHAAREIHNIVLHNNKDDQLQAHGRQVAEELYNATEEYLKS